jgi:transposase
MPILRGGGVDGWIVLGGPARAGIGGGGGGRDARGGGPKPRISGEVEAALLGLLREANHLTLAECRDQLAERTGVRVHPWTVGRALRRCGWT